MINQEEIFGIFEKVSIPSLGINDVLAKIDTGAYSGSLHCSKIKEITRKSDGKKVLRFVPSENHSNKMELVDYHIAYVRSSSGHRVKRFLFDTDIVIKGSIYSIRIGLSDRSDMMCEILIGRRFLRENNIIVDVRINQELDTDGEKR
ncbi:MAG: RimK/LysX family protein [Candidatus Saccharibacteria bacterium]